MSKKVLIPVLCISFICTLFVINKWSKQEIVVEDGVDQYNSYEDEKIESIILICKCTDAIKKTQALPKYGALNAELRRNRFFAIVQNTYKDNPLKHQLSYVSIERDYQVIFERFQAISSDSTHWLNAKNVLPRIRTSIDTKILKCIKQDHLIVGVSI